MSGNETGRGGEESKSVPGNDLSERLKRLETQLERKRPAAGPDASARSGRTDGSSIGQAMRLSTEFVAGVIAGGILGWLFDRLLGTAPWGLVVFLVLGFITGIYNVMRLSGFTGQAGGKDPQ
ncbi:ATP F0F1 synthase subunit I [Methylobacterium sp. C25]|uniref:AtpZ/AtpI family protein n=1 Tax=Methylobacterium sp. C25 TaxID=2721622 RepID=UPI001F409A5E|nr:AtpZ/AtpI family protein [Methylobacterium sp. C25]MCE4224634.1 ATP F0F1 synthase subunit I [Methylobacterium sp. C25]